jgi:GNAT superfamily N-acetyltransferase
LLQDSESEGYGFIRRLVDDYASGANRFEAPGEALYGAYYPGLVGICGLNCDPYLSDPDVGRVRHLYVLHVYRRAGIGRSFIETLIADARRHFRLLVLRTTNQEADRFYHALGFSSEPRFEQATHYLDLSGTDGERGETAEYNASP